MSQQFLWILLLLLGCNHASSYSWFDFPDCPKCPRMLSDMGDGINVIIDSIRLPVTSLCRLNEQTEDSCMDTFDLVESIMTTTNRELFPRKNKNVSRAVVCSHALRICPDKTSKGKELTDGKWSCVTCQEFFDKLFTLISKPLERINEALPNILCDPSQDKCKNAFSSAVQLTGTLDDILKKKTTTDYACKQLMSCVSD